MQQRGSFRVVTLNLLYDPPEPSWPDRAQLVATGLRTLAPDIVLLQEVAWPNEQAGDLAAFLESSLGSPFTAHVTPLLTPHGWQEGLGIITRFPAVEHDALQYPDAELFCQRVRITAGDHVIDLYNTHLDPYAEDRRREQIRLILGWMGTQTVADGIVFGGDLNATPDSDAISPLRAKLHSAHVTVHGREPAGTAPTPLRTIRRGKTALLRTIDYLWHSSTLAVTECRVVFEQPDPRDPVLFASDHYGLFAQFRLLMDRGTS